MYSKDKTIISSKELSLEPYIQGNDLLNSKLIYMIPKLPSSGVYTIDLTEYRIDLISLDLYETDTMSQVLLLYNGLTIKGLTKGTKLKVPYIKDVRNLMQRIASIDSPREYLKDLEG